MSTQGYSPAEIQRMLNGQHDARAGTVQESQTMQLATQLAGQRAGHIDKDIWDDLGDPDIAIPGEDDDLEELLATELSNKNVYAYLPSWDEWNRLSWLAENEFKRVLMEFPDEGSTVTDETRWILCRERDGRGQPAPKQPLSPEMERRLVHADKTKKMMLTLAVHGFAIRKMSDVHAVSESKRPGERSRPSGKLARFKEWLL